MGTFPDIFDYNFLCETFSLLLLSSCLLGPLSTVLGTSLIAVSNTGGIQSSSDDVVSYTRQILYTAASDKNYTVLLKVMTDTRDISSYFDSVGKTYTSDFTKCGVRLLRGNCLNRCADSPLLRCLGFCGNSLE